MTRKFMRKEKIEHSRELEGIKFLIQSFLLKESRPTDPRT
jgi:hypothetical protein